MGGQCDNSPQCLEVTRLLESLQRRARALKVETHALYLAVRDPRTPWYARAVAGAVVAYALSPFDLIPDFLPVIGYLDDLILVPLGIALALRLIPAPVMADCRQQAQAADRLPMSRAGAAFMIAAWLAAALVGFLIMRNLLAS
jgi:uncharacterized membrane protein YkvA (DUF1232 family)